MAQQEAVPMRLRPDSNVQKVLISTTSRFEGEYHREAMLLTHAWPVLDQRPNYRWSEGPTSRSAFVLAFETEPEKDDPERPVVVRPDYTGFGSLICAYLAVLFGKRFDCHGMIENDGRYHIPDLAQFGQLCNPALPQNSYQSRADFPVPLNLTEASRMEPLLAHYLSNDQSLSAEFCGVFYWASKFYLQALQTVERDPEVAYLHLVTAGEVLAEAQLFEKRSLLSDEMEKRLGQIEREMRDGANTVNFILKQMPLVRQRFTKTIVGLTDPGFFERTESGQPYAQLKAESFVKAVKSAYDLRSRYVHAGAPFKVWMNLAHGNEMQLGEPVVGNKEYGRLLAAAPAYGGLERIIRYCLLRFAQKHGAYLDR
jgi:hypothetical protein